MQIHSWKKLISDTATILFVALMIAQPVSGQTAATPWQEDSTRARIRLHNDAQQSPTESAAVFQIAPIPKIDSEDPQPKNHSLLAPRFSGFPKTNVEHAAANQPASVNSGVVPVAWQPPTTTLQPMQETEAQDPQVPEGTELAQISPDDPFFEGLKGKVRIIVNEKTQKLTLIGDPADVAIVTKKLAEIRESTEEEERMPERIPLRYSASETIVESIRQIYNDNYESKVGRAEIVPLTSPNALLVFGSQAAIDGVKQIVDEIEGEMEPEDAKDFASFALEHISAADAKRRLEEFFGGGDQGEAFPVGAWTVVADYRANVVAVRGNAQVLQQAKLLIDAIDIDEDAIKSVKSVRVFQLQNAVAGDLAIILQDAINGALKNVTQPLVSNAQGGGIQPGQPGQDGNEFSSEATPSRLQLQTVGKDGKVVTSGALFDVRVTPDSASNSLIVRGPASAMPLVAELIRQLDRLPNAETLIKVFQIVNGDAEQLLTMLESIFGADDAQGGNQLQGGALAELPLQTASTTPGAALVNLRFAIDQRTNSIIATGPAGDLQVVEDLLNRLDEDMRSRRETAVYRLSNSNVLDVAESLNNLLDSRSSVLAEDPRTAGGAVLADQEIVIVPELGSNSLIISALPENFPEIENIIRRLDRRPPMVKVKVLLAEVNLGSLEEFGVEVGIQDSLLFDRSTTVDASGAITGGSGFDFNSAATSNLNATFPETLAGQALSNLAIGRTNAELGYGGLVLSGGNESINVLIRALKDRNCLRVLSRPHIMTLENLQGRVLVGQQVGRIAESTTNQFGNVINSVNDVAVGVILEITPRVSPDGTITMFVNVVKSSLGSESDGTVVSVSPQGQAVRQAPIDSTEAQTTLLAKSGQTIVFSGLIQETKEHGERGAPILSDLPFVGPLFKFEQDRAARSELLIIMTPTLVDTTEMVDAQNADEMERMHWCLCDVAEVYGDTGIDPVHADFSANETIYEGDEDFEWSSQNDIENQQIDGASQIDGKPASIKQTGFLDKMKTSLKDSPVGKIADHIRSNNPPNRNDRNRRDFEELKRLRSQRQE